MRSASRERQQHGGHKSFGGHRVPDARSRYADGPQRWTIFREDEPIATFPTYAGDLAAALVFHDLERLNLRAPDEVRKELEAESKDGKRFRFLGIGRKIQELDLSDPQVIEAIADEIEEGDEE